MSSQFLENEQMTGRDKKNSVRTMLAAAPSDSWFIADVGKDRIELDQHPTVPSTNAVTLTSVICEYSCGLDIVRESVEEEPKRKYALMSDLLTSKPKSVHRELHADLRTLLLAQKTELISELTRATANQFNNTMMAVTSYAELEMKKAASSQRGSLEQVLSNAVRATALVQKLLAISRKQTASSQPLNLNNVLTGISNLLEPLSGERVSVAYKLDPSIPMVNADPVEIEHVVLSLAIHARNAMAKGGRLTVSTRLVDLNAESVGMGEIEHPGKYVMLSVDDTGHGGSAKELVSSQDQDARINLSLAAVRSIVKNAGGYIRFNTDPGKGNSFNIYFPSQKQDGREDSKRSSPRNVPVARTILVVEDDDAVRIPTSEFLKMEGFKVLQARTGEEAIHVVEQNRARLDVLIADIVMPKMTGRQVAEKLLALHSDLKILYMSGDTEEAQPARAADSLENMVLRKPFRLDTLKDKIHELLGE
jgi:CheY-like chemotaxis protein/nitrogen-specific signal transduction histidine kinase